MKKPMLVEFVDQFGIPWTESEWKDFVSKDDLEEVTTTANIATFPVPLGVMRPSYFEKDKKKKKTK